MDGSGKIRIIKRDGEVEDFDPSKLAGTFWRVMKGCEGCTFYHAIQLSVAVELYLEKTHPHCISSAALFEMCLKVFRQVELVEAAELLEDHQNWRSQRRLQVKVRHDRGEITLWDKNWLARVASGYWNLSLTTGRILAADIEKQLLEDADEIIPRSMIIEMLNARVAQFGLADAVPVRPKATSI